jgi:hypothetical protein
MKYCVAAVLLTASWAVQAGSTNADASVTYNIALQNEYGVERQTVTLPVGGALYRLNMAGGVVEIDPPGPGDERSLVKLFTDNAAAPVLLHTTHIETSAEKPLEIAYTMCGRQVRFQSPTPEKLEKCPGVAGAASH